MKNSFKEYFSFSDNERKGIIVLLVILVLLIAIWKVIPLLKNEKYADSSQFEKEIIDFENSLIKSDSQAFYSTHSDPLFKLFPFNPNLTEDSSWLRLGLTQNQINSIRNFLKKGGKFRTKEDFKKMYCLKPRQYETLEPYIDIPENNKVSNELTTSSNKVKILHDFDPNCTEINEWKELGLTDKQIKTIENYLSKGGKFRVKEDFKKMYCIQPLLYDKLEPYILITPEPVKPSKYDPDIKVDINIADSAELRKIKGLNPYLAKNIVKYRNSLGGFIYKKQILEVWGMKNDTYNNIEKNLFLSDISIKKIDLNTAVFSELIKHPYLSYDLTRSLMQYKKIVGKIKSVQELITNKIIPDSAITKIKPYLLQN